MFTGSPSDSWLGGVMGADSLGMAWESTWREGFSGNPAAGAVLGMTVTFGEVLSSSRMDWRQAVFPW